MSAYTNDISAVARYRIEDRVREADARRIARVARTSASGTETTPARARRPWRWIPFTRRAFA